MQNVVFRSRLWVVLVFLYPVFAHAQSDVLDRYVQIGLENNLALKSQELSLEKSRQALREAKGLFFPQVGFNASYTLAGGGRSLDFPVGDLLNPVYATLNQLTETQQFPTNIENVNEQFLPNNFQETKIRVIQPLLNSDIYFNHKAKQSLIKVEKHQREAYQKELIKEIKTAYFGLLQAGEVVHIYQESEKLLREVLRVNQRLVENHKATPEVISRAEHELSKLKKAEAEAIAQQQTARAFFNFLINRPLDRAVDVDSSLNIRTQLDQLDVLTQYASTNRQEIDQLKAAQAANLQAISLNKYAALPRLSAVLDVGFQGYGYTFDQDQRYWLAQVSLQWDLFQGSQRKARLEQSRLDQQMLQQQYALLNQQVHLQVQQAWNNLSAAQSSLDAARSGIRSSTQTFNLINKKYLQDQASLLEWLDARTQLTQAQISVAIDTYAYLSKHAELEWAIGR